MTGDRFDAMSTEELRAFVRSRWEARDAEWIDRLTRDQALRAARAPQTMFEAFQELDRAVQALLDEIGATEAAAFLRKHLGR